MSRIYAILAAVAAFVAAQVPGAVYAESAYRVALTCGGETLTNRDHPDGVIEAVSFSHKLTSTSAGVVMVEKVIDTSSVGLREAMLKGESCAVKLEFLRRNPATSLVGVYFTIELVDARVKSVDSRMQNLFDKEGSAFPLLETVAFSYGKIKWTVPKGGTYTYTSRTR